MPAATTTTVVTTILTLTIRCAALPLETHLPLITAHALTVHVVTNASSRTCTVFSGLTGPATAPATVRAALPAST